MTLIRSRQSRQRLEELHTHQIEGKKVLISAFLRPSQKAIVDMIAKDTGKGKGEVLRDIFDEWVSGQLEH